MFSIDKNKKKAEPQGTTPLVQGQIRYTALQPDGVVQGSTCDDIGTLKGILIEGYAYKLASMPEYLELIQSNPTAKDIWDVVKRSGYKIAKIKVEILEIIDD